MNLGGPPRPSIAATPAATTAATTPASAAELEVTGIVGGVIVRNNVITVRPLSGASITKINVDAQTAIRSADGGSLSLGEIRPSERIVARGVLNDRGDGLLAREITVQAVVSGGQPGG